MSASEQVPAMIDHLVDHVTKLRAVLTSYRNSRDHLNCVMRFDVDPPRDIRCRFCRAADDVLGDRVEL